MSRSLKQLTIRGFGEALARKIRETARREGVSLNQAVLRLLNRAAGLDEPEVDERVVGRSLDDLIGTWTDEEARELAAATAELRAIDQDMWR